MRPSFDGAMGEGWKGLHTGWGYRKSMGIGGGRVQQYADIKEMLGKDTKKGSTIKTGGFDPFKKGMKSLKNGGTGNGKPVLVHKGEVIISNPFGRRGGRRP